MDNEAKVTYSVVAIVVVFLAGIAYFLQPMGVENFKENNQVNKKVTKTTNTALIKQEGTKSTTTQSMDQKQTSLAVITTNKGIIEFELGTTTPLTTDNFKKLATSGYYSGIRFHRVIKGFMIQAGDPLSKDKANESQWGTGGPGYTFKDELTGKEQYSLGTVAMANAGPNTNGSQFFIVTANPSVALPPNYTVFGKVTKGIETALAIQEIKTTGYPKDQPLEDIIIEKIEIK